LNKPVTSDGGGSSPLMRIVFSGAGGRRGDPPRVAAVLRPAAEGGGRGQRAEEGVMSYLSPCRAIAVRDERGGCCPGAARQDACGVRTLASSFFVDLWDDISPPALPRRAAPPTLPFAARELHTSRITHYLRTPPPHSGLVQPTVRAERAPRVTHLEC
jgi:hypothetical protein